MVILFAQQVVPGKCVANHRLSHTLTFDIQLELDVVMGDGVGIPPPVDIGQGVISRTPRGRHGAIQQVLYVDEWLPHAYDSRSSHFRPTDHLPDGALPKEHLAH